MDIQLKNEDEILKIMTLCGEYRGMLWYHFNKRFPDEQLLAEDCIQDAYAALLENLKKGVQISNYYGWLYKVMFYCAYKAHREEESEKSNVEYSEDMLDNIAEYLVALQRASVSSEEIHKITDYVVSSLTNREKQFYFLRFRDGKKLKEIAKEMGITIDNAKQLSSRTQKKIKVLITDYRSKKVF